MKKIFIVAGETSGDRHAANLVQALKQKNPNLEFFGLGGNYLKQAGVRLLADITTLAVVGFFEVLANIFKFKKIFSQSLEAIQKEKPAACILVDYPGFNLRLAVEIKKLDIPVIYYISPQVWAWHKSRVNLIKKYVDKMIVVFDFEKEFYKQFGIEVDFVGHPLLDLIKIDSSRDEFLKKIGLSIDKKTIALLPGSRKKEINTLLPIMLNSARIIAKQGKTFQFLLIQSKTVQNDPGLNSILARFKDINLSVVDEQDIYNGLNCADFCLVASGTATLETALLNKPMVIIYKLSPISFILARLLIKIPYIGLVNVVAQEKIVPELIQFDARPELIARTSLEILSDDSKYNNIVLKLKEIRKKLGQKGAGLRASQIIDGLIRTNN
jgi:lipid-A-disaccharide synthase